MTELQRPEAQPRGTRGWATFASVLAVLGLAAGQFGDPGGRSTGVPTAARAATPVSLEPGRPPRGAAPGLSSVSEGVAVREPVPAVDVTSVHTTVAGRVARTDRSTDTATAAPTTGTEGTAEQPTFLQVDRSCSATTLLVSSSAWPDCPARSTSSDLWWAAADAGMRGSTMFVSASARAPAATVVGTAQASATWAGRALRNSEEGGLLRVHLTGVSGGVDSTCSACAIAGTASLVIVVEFTYVGADGDTVRRWTYCDFGSGEPVPASVTVPDDCVAADPFEVPPRTPIWVDLQLYANADNGTEPELSAALHVASATLDLP